MCNAHEIPYNLRSGSGKRKRRRPQPTTSIVPRKRLRSFDYINYLPDEMLIQIFSYIPPKELFQTVSRVCIRWRNLAKIPPLWKNLCIDRSIPTGLAMQWLQFAPTIKHLCLYQRDDTDLILAQVCKGLPHLESISVFNSWGSTRTISLKSTYVCRLLTRCTQLKKVHLEAVKVRSCKFFKLLVNWKYRSVGLPGEYSFFFTGPLNARQFQLLQSICEPNELPSPPSDDQIL